MRNPKTSCPRLALFVTCMAGAHGLLGFGEATAPPGDPLTALLETAPVFDVVPEAVFGLSGGIEDALTAPQFVGTDEDGYVYIHDHVGRGKTELKRFAPTGEFDRIVVRGGDGPFQWVQMNYPPNLFAVWVESSHSIVVWNPPTREILVFDMRGRVLARSSWAQTVGDFEALLPVGRWEGDFLAFALRTEPSRGYRPIQFEGYLRVREDGVVVDTVWSQRRPADWIEVNEERLRARPPVVALPLPHRWAQPFGPGGLLEVQAPDPKARDSGRLTLRLVGRAETPKSRVLSYHPVSIPGNEVRERLLRPYRERFPPSALRALERNLDVPRFAPPLLFVRPFPDGSIWVRLAWTWEALLRPGSADDFLVLGLEDEPAFRVSLPRHQSLAVDAAGRIWMTMSTEVGEPYVARFVTRK